jgi:hypothetical protein
MREGGSRVRDTVNKNREDVVTGLAILPEEGLPRLL